ncbi:hypothetical protein NKH47_01740 [Mesorhizobium sp. M1060]|uniref:hypothetical protein n=1 Tax=Mesorhizobium sp. M1060 TaxID=2957052 RepID=UPI0033352178
MVKRRGRSVPPTSRSSSSEVTALARIDAQYKTARLIVKWLGIVFAIMAGGYALRPFAGERTIVSLAFSFLADVKFALAITLTGAAVAWAAAERMLRRRKTEQLQDRIIDLERRIDPNRTTSGLTKKGMTNPRDLQ